MADTKIELTQAQKNKCMEYSNGVRAAQEIGKAYLNGLADAFEVPSDYVFDQKNLCFVKPPEEKPITKEGK